MRAAVLALLLAAPAIADDVCLPKEPTERGCLQLDGEVSCPEDRVAASGNVKQALARCGDDCRALRKRLDERKQLVAAVDPTGKLLFEIDDGYPTRGSLWSLKTGKRVSRFVMDDFGGPPPPTSFDQVEFIGRHVFVGDPDEDWRITYDIYTGAMEVLFQSTPVAHALVIHIDGMGRVDLRDYAQPGAPIVATRRVKAHKRDDATLIAHAIVRGERAVVATEDPQVTVSVDARKRKISRPRPLARCE